MSLSPNLLGLSQKKFGRTGIHVGNLVSQEVAKQDKGLKAQYDPVTNKISILNTSDLPPSILDKILYGSLAWREYDQCKWYPVIEKERDANKNLQIRLTWVKPGTNTSSREYARTTFQTPPALSSLGLPLPLYRSTKPLLSSNPNFITEEMAMPRRVPLESFPTLLMLTTSLELEEPVGQKKVDKVSKAIANGVGATMTQFFNKHDLMRGIWYPNDYIEYLRDEIDSEMDPSFFTGYAKNEFFEKTGRFTFRLKEGKNASDAIRNFLEGPTVADCTMQLWHATTNAF